MTEQNDSAASTRDVADKGGTAEKLDVAERAGVDGHRFKTGVAVGIGSAAIVAALIYSRQGRARKK